MPSTRARIPNTLTLLRLGLAAAFFICLAFYRFPETNLWVLPVSTALFVLAAITDAADGYLARRWQVISVFGRIMDPFADKILILGAFVMLSGPNFAVPFGPTATGVAPWMVIVILARELLVTTIRAVCESRGIDFSASASGKLKMIAQSVGVPAILIVLWLNVAVPGSLPDSPTVTTWMSPSAYLANRVIAWSITIITIWSAVPYVTRALSAVRSLPATDQ